MTTTWAEPLQHAIIGGGFSGLGVAAAFKRHGIPFEVLERDTGVGGNWRHGVYEGVHIISSRKTTQYSDYPMPERWPDFPSGAQMLEYLESYAAHHGLAPHIRFGTEVVRVAPLGREAGTWAVTTRPAGAADDSAAVTRTYAGVVVCNGHHWAPRLPDYPGRFDGELIHAKAYRSREQLRGKRVLVIGGGNSACDIAVEAARVGRASSISLRRGYWFLPKTFLGVPLVELMQPWMPPFAQRALARTVVRLAVGRYEQYGLPHPDHAPFERHPTINSELLYLLRHGRITAHPDIARYDGAEVEFVDGARGAFDLVVAATGYDVRFPFLAEGVVSWSKGFPVLMGGVMPPDHKNIYFFGLGQPRYGAGPLISAGAELLCTAVATQRKLEAPLGAVLAGLGSKPPRTWLLDPFAALRRAKFGRRVLPLLPAVAPWALRRARARAALARD